MQPIYPLPGIFSMFSKNWRHSAEDGRPVGSWFQHNVSKSFMLSGASVGFVREGLDPSLIQVPYFPVNREEISSVTWTPYQSSHRMKEELNKSAALEYSRPSMTSGAEYGETGYTISARSPSSLVIPISANLITSRSFSWKIMDDPF